MFVHYKLKSTVKYETVAFDGPSEHHESRRHQNRDRSISYREEERPTRSPYFRRSPSPEKYRKHSDDYLQSSRRSPKKGRDIVKPGNCYGDGIISYREDERPSWSPTFRRCPRRSPPPEKYRKHATDYLRSFRRSPKKERDIANPGNYYRDESISYRKHERPAWSPTFRRSPPLEKYRKHSDDYLGKFKCSPKKKRDIANPGNCYGDGSIFYRKEKRPAWSPTFRRSPPLEKYSGDYLQSFRRFPQKKDIFSNPGICYEDENVSHREEKRPAWSPTFRKCPRQSPSPEKYREHSGGYLRSSRPSPKKEIDNFSNPGNCYEANRNSYGGDKRPARSPTFGRCPKSPPPGKYREHSDGYQRSSRPTPKKERDISYPGNYYGDESMFSGKGYLRSPSPSPKERRTCEGNAPQTSGRFFTEENDYSKDTRQGRDKTMSYNEPRTRSPESLKSFCSSDTDCEREDNSPRSLKPPPKEGNELSSRTHHSRDRMGRERY
nr:serine/arginine repetitive matrix protein 1-like [Leptinotarsa decemlineata]